LPIFAETRVKQISFISYIINIPSCDRLCLVCVSIKTWRLEQRYRCWTFSAQLPNIQVLWNYQFQASNFECC